MDWKVEYTGRSRKQLRKLPVLIQDLVLSLVIDMKSSGPVRGEWPNFSKLHKNRFHCHLKKGKPTYVICWKLVNKKIRIIEVYYVGTHEKAPY